MKKRYMRFAALLCAVLCLTVCLTSCNAVKKQTDVTISIRDFGDVMIRLDPDAAPITVNNFRKLVSEGFYDGLTFHRIADLMRDGTGYVIQGGDPIGDGSGGSSQKIVGEFSSNGYKNNLSHVRGTVSMARGDENNSASSQFFICAGNDTFLDGKYAAFGTVISGMEVVDAVVDAYKANSSLVPVMEKVTMTEKNIGLTKKAAGWFGALITVSALALLYVGYMLTEECVVPKRIKGKKPILPDSRAVLCRKLFIILSPVLIALCWVCVYMVRWYTLAMVATALVCWMLCFAGIFVFDARSVHSGKNGNTVEHK